RREAAAGARHRRAGRAALPPRDTDPAGARAGRRSPVPHAARGHARSRRLPASGPAAADRAGRRRPRTADAPRVRPLPAWPGRNHRQRHPRCPPSRSGRGVPRARPRRRGVRPRRGWWLLAGGIFAATARETVPPRALVERARARRHAGELPRPACRVSARTARRRHGGRSGEASRMKMPMTPERRARLRRLARMPLVSPRLWLRRLVFWIGATLVSVFAIGFATGADLAMRGFQWVLDGRPWLAFILAPAGLVISLLLTRHVFQGAQGSGIPQVIAALHMTDEALVARVLSLRIAVGKILLTLLGLASGASIGHAVGKRLRLPRVELQRALVLAGGAAGIAAAFNTPLAGVVFAIEEL